MKLIIVDDHSLFRSGLATLFKSQDDFQVVGEGGTIREAVALIETQQPDLLIMDVGLPDGSGLEAIPKLLRKKPELKIVILTIHALDEHAFAAVRLGAKGFLLKDISAAALLQALRGLERGELAISRAALSRLFQELMPFVFPHFGDRNPETTLTMREIEVLSELATGESNLEIAQRLSISENTLKIHVHNVLHKLKLNNRQEAAAYARRHGLTHAMLVQLRTSTVEE
jgi:two-component system nitrate/nitrite response regulator NarL